MNSNEHQTLTLSDGRRLGYAEYGDPKGKPIFLFHGWPGARFANPRIAQEATKQHIHLIVMDRPGFGISHYQKNRTLLDWPKDVIALADHLQLKKFAILGISGGGPYAAATAYAIPERLTNVAIAVGLAPTWIPGILQGMLWNFKIGWKSYPRFPFMTSVGAAMMKYFPISTFGHLVPTPDRSLVSELREYFLLIKKEAFRQGVKGPGRDLFLYTHDWGFDVRDIKPHVHLFYGEADTTVPLSMGKYYASHIPHNTFISYPNEGHTVSVIHIEEIFNALS